MLECSGVREPDKWVTEPVSAAWNKHCDRGNDRLMEVLTEESERDEEKKQK